MKIDTSRVGKLWKSRKNYVNVHPHLITLRAPSSHIPWEFSHA